MGYCVVEREAATRLLEGYGCSFIETCYPGFEVWKTATGQVFTLALEHGDVYDEMTLSEAIRHAIGEALPEPWPPADAKVIG